MKTHLYKKRSLSYNLGKLLKPKKSVHCQCLIVMLCVPNIVSTFGDVNSTWPLHDRPHSWCWTSPTSDQLLSFVPLSRWRKVSRTNSTFHLESFSCRLRYSYLLCWIGQHSYHEATVWHSFNSSFWNSPQLTQPASSCCSVDYRSCHTLTGGWSLIACALFPFSIVPEVLSMRITDTWIYDNYTDDHMTQRFHTFRWKIPH